MDSWGHFNKSGNVAASVVVAFKYKLLSASVNKNLATCLVNFVLWWNQTGTKQSTFKKCQLVESEFSGWGNKAILMIIDISPIDMEWKRLCFVR